jgi:antitoxin (DNA-binding transcriptional repressor) of toxin-antitoxin stability system
MNATLVDLRYRTKDIMRAIERNETVHIFSHGKLKAEMTPVEAKAAKKKKPYSVLDDPIFGSRKQDSEPVHDVVRRMREGRFGR